MNKTFTKLGMIVAFMLSFLSASAYDFEVDGIYYNVPDIGKNECVVIGYSQVHYSDEINIPAEISYNGRTVTVVGIGSGAFEGCTALVRVKMPDSIVTIGNYAFANCFALSDIAMSNSLVKIGDNAFESCSSLLRIDLSNSLTSIGAYAFNKCSSLTNITIPDSITSVEYFTFANCKSLINVKIPANCTYLSGFTNCTSLTNIDLPDSLETIGDLAFAGCTALDRILIPNSVISIGERAFEECCSLTSIDLPNSVITLDTNAFRWCSSLRSVKLSESLYRLNEGIFYGCSNFKNLVLSGNIQEIVMYAVTENSRVFENLEKLDLKYSPNNLRSVRRLRKLNTYEAVYWPFPWESYMTNSLEEVFFDRQMEYKMSLPNVNKLSFGEHLKEVQVENIQNCEKLDTIVSYAVEPPTLPECSNNQYMNVVVKVPQESLEKYQQAANWKNFWNLQGFDASEAGVGEVTISPADRTETARYDLSGRKVSSDYEGIVIIRYSDGSTRKMISQK